MARTPSTQPTDGELEILNVLWNVGRCDLGTIRATLQQKRPVATTTIATMLKLMRDKGLVERGDGPRGYTWSAKITRKAARAGLIGRLVDLAFEGSARGLVAHMLEAGKLSAQDRQEIRRLLDEGEQKPRPKKGETRS
ncbi:MAG TPA: BlaI/MecI/CopY family transcriptional regulator [Pirellulales bacterium]|nr:BlaI/MecI/CopY family transcriptional regulator [Pirellulales bacterium]